MDDKGFGNWEDPHSSCWEKFPNNPRIFDGFLYRYVTDLVFQTANYGSVQKIKYVLLLVVFLGVTKRGGGHCGLAAS